MAVTVLKISRTIIAASMKAFIILWCKYLSEMKSTGRGNVSVLVQST